MQHKNMAPAPQTAALGRRRPLFVAGLSVLLALGALGSVVWGVLLLRSPAKGMPSLGLAIPAIALVAGLLWVLAWGTWQLKNWARTTVFLLLLLAGAYYAITVLFHALAQIFGGAQVVPLRDMLGISFSALLRVAAGGAIPGAILYGLACYSPVFEETPGERQLVDHSVQVLLIAAAFSAIIIVFLIILFTVRESWSSIREVGLGKMIGGLVWRPGSGDTAAGGQFGMFPMIIGSILSTFGAVVLGVPLSLGAAILFAEVAPQAVREVLRPAVELLAGIPSVVYGLFGMVVLAPLIRRIQVPYNSGFNILNASIILAIMIMPTVTNIAEDAIRAVPKAYKEGSLALGATRWQTIRSVSLPAARSGILAAVILGIGRALGETMAVIMVMGNSIAMPKPLNANPLTLFLSSARTLTGNIAVEINYAAGVHRSALFFTGVLLFVMILLVNGLARYLMRERLKS
jgi:phosphate transport system permease protein